MEERKFVKLKKNELAMKKYIWDNLGKGKVSSIKVEYTPIGEKIIVATDKPGLVIGARGERITELTEVLKKRFKLENPHIEIDEIKNPNFDAKLVADRIALALERYGNLKFKTIAYRELTNIMKSGASGAEIRLNGKLPSDRAKNWRFAAGYLKKVGDSAKVVNRAKSIALTKLGITGIKVSILTPDAKIYDRIEINDELKKRINEDIIIEEVKEKPKRARKKKEEKDREEVKKLKKRKKEEKKEGAEESAPAEEKD